jgi:hypothetical protein
MRLSFPTKSSQEAQRATALCKWEFISSGMRELAKSDSLFYGKFPALGLLGMEEGLCRFLMIISEGIENSW